MARARQQVETLKAHVGRPFPALALMDLAGRTETSASAIAGRSSLVLFFSPSCDACRRELRALDQATRENGDAVQVIAISVLGLEATQVIARELRPAFHVLVDRDAGYTRVLGGFLVPVAFLTGHDGRIARVAIGEQTLTQLRALTAGPAPWAARVGP
jgi:peroxiredoxin